MVELENQFNHELDVVDSVLWDVFLVLRL